MKQLVVNTDTTKQTVVDYINASNDVSRYAASIMVAALPDLVMPPPNYGDYANAMTDAKLHVAVWINEVIPDFSLIPNSFINFNTLLQTQLNTIEAELNELKTNPGNTANIQNIKDALNTLISEAASVKKVITGLDTDISTYQSNILPDAKILSQLAQQIAVAENADEASIEKMNEAFNNLQTLVDNRNKLATLNTLSNFDMGVFLAVVGIAVGVAFTGGAGIVIGGIVGLGGAAYTTFDPVHTDPDFEQSLSDIQTEMNSINSEIGLMNSTIGLLQQLANTFNTLASNSDDASKQIQVVLSFWEHQESDLNQLYNDIEDVLSVVDSGGNVDQALADIADARTSWDDVYQFMLLIKDMTYTVTETQTAYQEAK